MRFFEAQRIARRNTITLAVLFCLTVVVLSIFNAIMVSFFLQSAVPRTPFQFGQLEIKAFIGSSLIFAFTTWVFLLRVPNGPKLAAMLGGRLLVDPKTDREKRLKNVVEEMAIASGVAIPQVYVLDSEESINAFAAGTDPGSIVIGVTKGTMTLLNRDELQAVIGHEFSHVLNEDLKLNMRLAAVVASFLAFVRMGHALLRGTSSERSRKKNGAVPFGMAFLVFGALGYFFGRLIQSFISQQREFLADASSAQFTRNPEALARALAKINLSAGSSLSVRQDEYAHIFFAEGILSKFSDWFASHPPVVERIGKLVPGRRIEDLFEDISTQIARDPELTKPNAFTAEAPLAGNIILASIGAPTEHNRLVSETILAQVNPVRGLLQDPTVARGVLALLTFYSQEKYQEAKEHVRGQFASENVFLKVSELVESADPQVRVSLFQFALATLKNLSSRDRDELLAKMEEVFRMDQKISLLEALLLINARILLGSNLAGVGGLKPGAADVLEMLRSSDSIEKQKLVGFIQLNRDIPLLKKKELLREIINPFIQAGRKEELRLLCLAIKVPVPPF
ncbi:M48 family metallopeptidase [Bdellovibrio sp. HCB2-146]|uniref:M48 family metallopeptidase n=1 Tax=Bdellovibrio sp. HCB2-146 TaxID=3394362 RepID=UPI0039BD373A